MNLDQAMLLLAQQLRQSAGDPEELTRQVRGRLLSLLVADGAPLPDLPAAERAMWHEWLTGLRQHPEAIAALYEQMLSRSLGPGPGGNVRIHVQRQHHRATGAYYTHPAVVSYMLNRARLYQPGAEAVIDPACGAGAFLHGARAALGNVRLTGLDSDPQALQLCRAGLPEADLHQLDALLESFSGGFDLCIGNPPYISSGLRGSVARDPGLTRRLRRRYPASAEYKLNTYPLFVERGLELLRAGGVLGYILPDSFLTGRYFARLRQLLLGQTLLELTLIRREFWANGMVGQSAILFVRKEPPPAGHTVAIAVCDTVADLAASRPQPVSAAELIWGPRSRFRLLISPAVRDMVARMEGRPGALPLGEHLRTYSGLIGRSGQQHLLRSGNPAQEGPWAPLLRSGAEIDRYRVTWAGEQVCLNPAGIKSGGRLEYYRQPKLLLRQTADSLRAAYDDTGLFCLNNIHLLLPRRPGPSLRSLLALINSGPMGAYYRAMAMETGRVYAQVDLDLVEALPVPPLPALLQERLAGLARRRESATPAEVAPLEAQIDLAVSRLFDLT